MLGTFKPEKAVQAAAILLKTADPHRMNYTRLLKLLYLAERDSLKTRARAITNDRVVAMKQGPVLSRTYDCIKGKDVVAPEWDRYIQRSGQFDVELVADPGLASLTRKEVDILHQVAEEHRDRDVWELVDLVHDLPEYGRNWPPELGAVRDIPTRHILEAVGLRDEADRIITEARGYYEIDQLLAQVAHV